MAVLQGGESEEREISLASGAALAGVYKRMGYPLTVLDARPGRDLPVALLANHIDVVVIALHGPLGEDGTVQGMLEVMGIAYSGSGVAASAICMDKGLCKRILRDGGIATPPWAEAVVDPRQESPRWLAGPVGPADLGPPLFVKPSRAGSSLGIRHIADRSQWDTAVAGAVAAARRIGTTGRILMEQAISGTEITLAVLDGEPLPLIEIRPGKGFYDYSNKYTAGRTRFLIPPAEMPKELARRAVDVGLAAGGLLSCRGLYRVDMIVDAAGTPWVLEVNTVPGLTENSLAPRAAAAAGISFDRLAERILVGADTESCGGWPPSEFS